MSSHDRINASNIVRAVFAIATVTFFSAGWIFRDDPRWFAAAGALGLIWWLWDILVEHVFRPLGDWFFGMLTGSNVGEPMRDLRPTIDDTIRLLESHLENDASQQVCVNAAIRLEEIYRTVKKDPARASQVVREVKERYPDAPEWELFDDAVGEGIE